MDDFGAKVKWRVTKNFVWSIWKFIVQKILFNNFYVSDISFGEISAEFFGGGVIWFDSNNMIYTMSESTSNYAGAGANFYNSIAFFKIGVAN